MSQSLINGMLLSLGLIVCLGAQNVFLLKQAARNEHSLLAALTCLICDIFLIVAGVFGMGYLAEAIPMLQPLLKWGAVGFLLYCALFAFKNGLKVKKTGPGFSPSAQSLPVRAVLFRAVGFSLLNPAALADTLLVIGGASQSLAEPDKMFFASGAVIGSGLWFFSLVLIVAKFRGLTSSPRFWQSLEFSSAFMFLFISFQVIRA